MDGIDVLKKVLTDSRFWLALWAFLQVPLVYLFGGDEFGRQMIAAANAFVGVLMAIIFGVSKSAATAQEVVKKERNLLKWDLKDANDTLTDAGVKALIDDRKAKAKKAKAAGKIADTDFQP